MDFNAIIQLLMQIFGMSTGGAPTAMPWLAQAGHDTTQITQIRSLLERTLSGVLPGLQRNVPFGTTAHDWDRIKEYSWERQKTQWAYMANNPMAMRAFDLGLDAMGYSAAKRSEMLADPASGLRTGTGILFNMLMGTGMGGQKAQAFDELSRFYQGFSFRGNQGENVHGMPLETAKDLTEKLYGATYKDKLGMFKRTPFIELSDMSAIIRMTTEHGGKPPDLNNLDEAVRNAASMAKVISAGMNIYKTMDKEKVMENIQALTRGRISVADTAGLETLLHQVNAMARHVNVSVGIMQQIGAQTAQLADQIGINPILGANLGMRLVGQVRQMTMGKDALSTEELAYAGGAHGLRQMATASTMEYLGSSGMQVMMAMLAASEQGQLVVDGANVDTDTILKMARAGIKPTPEMLEAFRKGQIDYLNEQKPGLAGNLQLQEALLAGRTTKLLATGKDVYARLAPNASDITQDSYIAKLQSRVTANALGVDVEWLAKDARTNAESREELESLFYEYYGKGEGLDAVAAKKHVTAAMRFALLDPEEQLKEQALIRRNAVISMAAENDRQDFTIYDSLKNLLIKGGGIAADDKGITSDLLEALKDVIPAGEAFRDDAGNVKKADMRAYLRQQITNGKLAEYVKDYYGWNTSQDSRDLRKLTRGVTGITGGATIKNMYGPDGFITKLDAALKGTPGDKTLSAKLFEQFKKTDPNWNSGGMNDRYDKWKLDVNQRALLGGAKFTAFVDALNSGIDKDKQTDIVTAYADPKIQQAYAEFLYKNRNENAVKNIREFIDTGIDMSGKLKDAPPKTLSDSELARLASFGTMTDDALDAFISENKSQYDTNLESLGKLGKKLIGDADKVKMMTTFAAAGKAGENEIDVTQGKKLADSYGIRNAADLKKKLAAIKLAMTGTNDERNAALKDFFDTKQLQADVAAGRGQVVMEGVLSMAPAILDLYKDDKTQTGAADEAAKLIGELTPKSGAEKTEERNETIVAQGAKQIEQLADIATTAKSIAAAATAGQAEFLAKLETIITPVVKAVEELAKLQASKVGAAGSN